MLCPATRRALDGRLLPWVLLASLLASLLAACATTPPPPPPRPPPVPTGPVLPVEPIPKEQYIASWIDFEVEEVFVGTPLFRAALHWLVAGRLHNRGNRTISWIEVRFLFEETGHREDVVVLDVFQEHEPLAPGETRGLNTHTARLEYGYKGDIDPEKLDSLTPPTVRAKVIELRFEDEGK